MKSIKLLCMYDDLLDLYGDGGNLRVLEYRLKEAGHTVEILHKSAGDEVDFSAADFVYIGPGMLSNLLVVIKDIGRHKQAIQEAIEKGIPFLVTGSSRALLGGELTTISSGTYTGLGLFDEYSVEQPKIEIVDVLCRKPNNQTLYYGFINRTMHTFSKAEYPMFEVESGCGDTPQSKVEGLRYKNLFATWLMGPVLAKNPEMLREMLDIIVGQSFSLYNDTIEQRAKYLIVDELLNQTN